MINKMKQNLYMQELEYMYGLLIKSIDIPQDISYAKGTVFFSTPSSVKLTDHMIYNYNNKKYDMNQREYRFKAFKDTFFNEVVKYLSQPIKKKDIRFYCMVNKDTLWSDYEFLMGQKKLATMISTY